MGPECMPFEERISKSSSCDNDDDDNNNNNSNNNYYNYHYNKIQVVWKVLVSSCLK